MEKRQLFSPASYTIAVIDSGIDQAKISGVTIEEIDFCNSRQQYETAPNDLIHGTEVIKTILAIAPDTSVISLKVTDEWGNLSLETLSETLHWIIRNHKDYNLTVICAAIADYSHQQHADPDKYRDIDQLISDLSDLGITFIAAAGNWFTEFKKKGEGMSWPAIHSRVLSTGALICHETGLLQLQEDSQRLHINTSAQGYTKLFAVPGSPGKTSGAAAVIAGRLAQWQQQTSNTDYRIFLKEHTQLITMEDGLKWPCLLK
jgi:hypothetical protein